MWKMWKLDPEERKNESWFKETNFRDIRNGCKYRKDYCEDDDEGKRCIAQGRICPQGLLHHFTDDGEPNLVPKVETNRIH